MKQAEFKRELGRLTDRTQDVRAAVGRVADSWKYDLEERKFGPALVDSSTGKATTELDLAVFMAALADRRAVVTLPKYKSRRAATRTEGEVVVSKENRHGRVMRLTSNKDVWSFNVLVEDANVITTGEVGKPRNFMLQDIDGKWHDGWKVVRFMADTAAEKKLFENAHEVTFEYFVHPNRWTSIYSRPYLLAKVAIERLRDQERFLKAERKRLRDDLGVEPPAWPKSEKVGSDTKIKVWAFNAFVDGAELTGEYEPYPTTHEVLEEIGQLLHRIGEFLQQLRFHTRASEFAFWKHAVLRSLSEDEILPYLKGDVEKAVRQPSWASGSWETGYKEKPKARTFFARYQRDDGLSVRWRAWQKSERVSV